MENKYEIWVSVKDELPAAGQVVFIKRSKGIYDYIGYRNDKPLSTNPDPSYDCYWNGSPLNDLEIRNGAIRLHTNFSDITVTHWRRIESASHLPVERDDKSGDKLAIASIVTAKEILEVHTQKNLHLNNLTSTQKSWIIMAMEEYGSRCIIEERQSYRAQEVDEILQAKMCGICGGKTVLIRGGYPGSDKREVCPTCTTERLEQIHEISNSNYGIAQKETE